VLRWAIYIKKLVGRIHVGICLEGIAAANKYCVEKNAIELKGYVCISSDGSVSQKELIIDSSAMQLRFDTGDIIKVEYRVAEGVIQFFKECTTTEYTSTLTEKTTLMMRVPKAPEDDRYGPCVGMSECDESVSMLKWRT
jgi:hypothetical protein